MLVVIQLYEYAENPELYNLKVNCMIHVNYIFNKTVKNMDFQASFLEIVLSL